MKKYLLGIILIVIAILGGLFEAYFFKFNNKSTAKVYCQVGYRIDQATDEQIISLHQEIEGNDEKIWDMVLKEVNTVSQVVASKYDPSSVIGGKDFETFKNELEGADDYSDEQGEGGRKD